MPTNDLTRLWDELNQHDWYSDRSDDHRVWASGTAHWNKIHEMAMNIPGGMDLIREFTRHFLGTGVPYPSRPLDHPDRTEEEE